VKENYIEIFTDLFSYVIWWSRTCAVRNPSFSETKGRIRSFLEQQLERVNRENLNTENYRQARFAACAWIDELVLQSEWEFRQEWSKDLIQTELYGTTHAGEEFFERLEALHPEQKSVREIYYLCLCLGFRGQYAWEEDLPRLGEIMRHQASLLPEPPLEPGEIQKERLIPSVDLDQSPAFKHPGGGVKGRRLVKAALIGAIGPAVFVILYLVFNRLLNGSLARIVS